MRAAACRWRWIRWSFTAPCCVSITAAVLSDVKVVGQVNLRRRQVHDIGLSPQMRVTCRRRSPLGSPTGLFGSGSWRTSVLPHLLLDAQRRRLSRAGAPLREVMNLSDDRRQSASSATHLDLLRQYARSLRGAVIADADMQADHRSELERETSAMGAKVVWAHLRSSSQPNVHDPLKLAAAYMKRLS